MGFIHGELCWVERTDNVAAAIDKMLAVVGHYPWSSRTIDVAPGPPAAVLATQHGPDDRVGEPTTRGGSPHGLITAADVRLDDRGALAAALGMSVAEARTHADRSLIELAYRRWGTGATGRLLGDGAFALWDDVVRTLLCWRDPVGIRPLYYYHEPGVRFVFSSDLQSMAAHPAVPARLDLAYMRGLLDAGGELAHPTRTAIAGVRKLPAAHFLLVDSDGVRLQRYWHPDRINDRHRRRDGEYVEELRELVVEAVRCRMPSTNGRAVGAHLTGGLDSSSLAVLAARQLQPGAQPLRAFSWAPSWEDVPEIDGDERLLVEAVGRSEPIEIRYAHLLPTDLLDIVCRDRALRPVTTLHYELATSRDAAAVGVHTMLSGWGGDETVAFNGRGYFATLARRGRFVTIQRELRRRAEIHGGTLPGAWKARVVTPNLPDGLVRRLGRPEAHALAVWPGELRPEFVRLLRDVEPLASPELRERPGVKRTQLSLLDQGHLQFRAESWASHGASLGLTYAFPLLDRRLVEFALSIPDRLYFRDGWKRWLYRAAMAGVLPDLVRWNPHKSDEAMVIQFRRAKADMRDRHRERLRARGSNDLVDVDVLLAGLDGRAPRLGGDPVAPPVSVGAAAWMAFTELQP